MENNGAVKHDEGKPRYDLIPPFALDLVAQVMTYGATKYGERNWEKGLKPERLFAALMRHSWAWMRGETIDPETKLPHLAHAAASVMMLIDTLQKDQQKGMTHGEFISKLGPEFPNEVLAEYMGKGVEVTGDPLQELEATRTIKRLQQDKAMDLLPPTYVAPTKKRGPL